MPSLAPQVATILRCGICPLRQEGACCALADESLEALSGLMIHRHFDAGAEIVHQEAPNELFAFIIDGVVKLTRMLPDGRQQIVGLLTVSDCLGDPFDPISHDSVECVTDVVLCCFPRKQFATILQNYPEIEHQLLLRTTRDLNDARSWMLSLGQRNAEEKIAIFLLWLLDKQQHESFDQSRRSNDALTVSIPFKRHEIGEFLGMTTETASRQFSKLRMSGAIRIFGPDTIEITNLDMLRTLAEEG